MRIKASSVFCHSCNEWLPRCKFELLHWHKAQICAKCEEIQSKKDAEKAKSIKKGEYMQNSKKPKAKSDGANKEAVKKRYRILAEKELMEIEKDHEL